MEEAIELAEAMGRHRVVVAPSRRAGIAIVGAAAGPGIAARAMLLALAVIERVSVAATVAVAAAMAIAAMIAAVLRLSDAAERPCSHGTDSGADAERGQSGAAQTTNVLEFSH